MRCVRILAVAGVTAVSATASLAADLGPFYPSPVPESFGAWYLRGDIGMTNQSLGGAHQALEDVVPETFTYRNRAFDSSPLFGVGIGYRWNDWLRFDVTGEYRSRANLHLTAFGNQGSVNDFHGSKSEFTALANVYVDLGTWYHLTPFIGAGVGASYNLIHDFNDTCAAGVCAGQITALADGTGSQWSLAWALHAGLAYEVTPGFTVELAYRYIDLGDAQSGFFHNVNPAASVAPGPYHLNRLTSQDIKLGVRWSFGGDYAPPPPISPRG